MKSLVKKIIPKLWFRIYSKFKNRNKSAEEVFSEIYRKGYWGKDDEKSAYFSGTGTHDSNTLKYVDMLCDFIRENKVKSIFEIGCGDFSIMKRVLEKSAVDYTGSDIVLGLVGYLQKEKTNEHTRFIHLDAIKSDEFPDADLCIIRQVLQHLSNSQIIQILQKTRKFKYVIVTEHLPLSPQVLNGNKSVSGYIRLQNVKTSGVFLDAPPFSLKCEPILSYRKDDEDLKGKIIPALMVSSLISNNYSVTTSAQIRCID